MLFLTKQEKTVLGVLVVVIFCGSLIEAVFKYHPSWRGAVSLMDSDKLYFKIDANVATKEQLIDIPYIGEYTAQKIIEYRETHGHFQNLEELKIVQGIKEKNFEKFKKYLTVK